MKFMPASLETIGDGDLIQKVNYELENAFGDIRDENKDPTELRVVTLKIKIKTDENRKYPIIEGVVTTKFPGDRAIVQMAYMDGDEVLVNMHEEINLEIDIN